MRVRAKAPTAPHDDDAAVPPAAPTTLSGAAVRVAEAAPSPPRGVSAEHFVHGRTGGTATALSCCNTDETSHHPPACAAEAAGCRVGAVNSTVTSHELIGGGGSPAGTHAVTPSVPALPLRRALEGRAADAAAAVAASAAPVAPEEDAAGTAGARSAAVTCTTLDTLHGSNVPCPSTTTTTRGAAASATRAALAAFVSPSTTAHTLVSPPACGASREI